MSTLAKELYDAVVTSGRRFYDTLIVFCRVKNAPSERLLPEVRERLVVLRDETSFINFVWENAMPDDSLSRALYKLIRRYEKRNETRVEQVDIWINEDEIEIIVETKDVFRDVAIAEDAPE